MAETAPGGDGSRPPCPDRPTSDDVDALGFVRRPMVRWLDPHQLVDTAARVLLAGLFSAYTDNRELQALYPCEVVDRSEGPELWFDYVADVGDGWNSTYTVAHLLVAEELKLEFDGDTYATERGRLLVMGGDQVYPVPKRVEYENRLLGPYRSALPCPPGDDAPELFAIPGSHDWYDGLVNFTSIFCRNRWIGGWRTQQRRSYFAVALPAGWWLWGVDIQFGSYLDEAQLQYFADVAEGRLGEGDRIVLCMAKEVDSGRSSSEIHSDRDIGYLEREVIQPAGAELAVVLKSGRHHYARYEEDGDGRQHVNSGGGGAFLHPTHLLPERLEVAVAKDDEMCFRRAAIYPSAERSRKLRKRMWLLLPYNLPLAGLLGAVQILLAFMLSLHLDERHVDLGLGDLRQALWESPTAFLLIVILLGLLAGMVRLAHDASGLTRFLLGVVHSALQLASVGGVLMAASQLSSGMDGAASLLAFLGLVGLLGGLGGTVGISGYLWVANCLGFHGNEGFASLHHQDDKHFLRFHVDRGGRLTLYPIAVDRVGRRWELRPDDPPHAPWFAPTGTPPEPRLIEAPLRIDRPGGGGGG